MTSYVCQTLYVRIWQGLICKGEEEEKGVGKMAFPEVYPEVIIQLIISGLSLYYYCCPSRIIFCLMFPGPQVTVLAIE